MLTRKQQTASQSFLRCRKVNVSKLRTTYQVLHHPLPLCPELPHRGEHVAPALPLDLLHQHRQPNIDTASVRSKPVMHSNRPCQAGLLLVCQSMLYEPKQPVCGAGHRAVLIAGPGPLIVEKVGQVQFFSSLSVAHFELPLDVGHPTLSADKGDCHASKSDGPVSVIIWPVLPRV